MIAIKLNDRELRKVARIHKGRQDRAKKYGRKPKYGQRMEDTSDDGYIGCLGEASVAKHYGAPWEPGPEPDDWDVAGAQVRATYHKTGKLVGHPGEPTDRIYILAWAEVGLPGAGLIGWTMGDNLIRDDNFKDWFRTGRPCHAVVQQNLSELWRLVYDEDADKIVEKVVKALPGPTCSTCKNYIWVELTKYCRAWDAEIGEMWDKGCDQHVDKYAKTHVHSGGECYKIGE